MAKTFAFAPFTTLINVAHADPQKVGKELEALRKRRGDQLNAPDVREMARRSSTESHKLFEWDLRKAGLRFQLEQARELIRSVRLIDVSDEERPLRAYLSVVADGKRSYRALEDVLDNAEFRTSVLASALRDIEIFQNRFRELQEIIELMEPARTALVERLREARLS